jgi:hypothetical protein
MTRIHTQIAVAIALGLLESAWTGEGRGGPTNTTMGVVAIFVILFIVTFPKVWRIPALAIIEEIVHGSVAYENWSLQRAITNHWSSEFTGVNFYPYILFPMITILGEFFLSDLV